MERWEQNLNALLALILACILFGALTLQVFYGEEPCPLCLLQRIGMLGVAAGGLMNCRFGSRKAHYGLSLFSCVLGGFVALRQIALHVCPGFSKFGEPFWGLSLYTWSFIIFASSVFYIGSLLILFGGTYKVEEARSMSSFCHFAFLLIFLVSFLNIIFTFMLCGWTVCQ